MAITQKRDGRWCVVNYVAGKQSWNYFGRGAEGEKKARDYDADLKATGKVRAYKKRPNHWGPVFTEVADAYLAAKAATLPTVSLKNMLYKFRGIILPAIGHLMVMKLTPEVLDAYVANRSRVVKKTTIHRELTDIHAVLNWAVKRRLIVFNPIKGHEKPKRDDAIIMPPTPGEIRAILAMAPDHLRRALIVTYYTGLRPGNSELFRLQWTAVDFDGEVIHVISALKGGIRERLVPLAPAFKAALKKWHREDKEKGFLIHFNGQPIKSIKTTWKNTKGRAGITRRLRPYDFRHAFASEMLKAGGDLKSTSEILGHSRSDTTMRIYQHTDGGMHRRNIKKLPDVLD